MVLRYMQMSAIIQKIWRNFLEHSNVQQYRCEDLSYSYVNCLRRVSISDGLLVRHSSFAVKIYQILFVVAPPTTEQSRLVHRF